MKQTFLLQVRAPKLQRLMAYPMADVSDFELLHLEHEGAPDNDVHELLVRDVSSPPSAAEAVPDSELHESELPHDASCWGSHLTGETVNCLADFVLGKQMGHFKNKFCQSCRRVGVHVPADRVRIVLPGCSLQNRGKKGFWSKDETGYYRLVNITHECAGSPILLVAQAGTFLPEPGSLDPAPDDLIGDEGRVHLIVSKGTLVPAARSRYLWDPAPEAAGSSSGCSRRSSHEDMSHGGGKRTLAAMSDDGLNW